MMKPWKKRHEASDSQRVSSTNTLCSEGSSPLSSNGVTGSNCVTEATSCHTFHTSSYSTFSSPQQHDENPTLPAHISVSRKSLKYSFSSILRGESLEPSQRIKSLDGHYRRTGTIWKVVIILSVIIGITSCLPRNSYDYMIFPDWQWDHNVYIPKHDSSGSSLRNERVSLLVQIVTGREMKDLAAITSRPNRAYAKQWGVDFARFNAGRANYYSRKSCFDKVLVLNEVLDRQSREDASVRWSFSSSVQYDVILMLPPDSIITDLDRNVVDLMMSEDKLVSVAGWKGDNSVHSKSDVILFNLKHKYAEAVGKVWWDLVLPSTVTCGANTDLELLLAAIESVMDPNEAIADFVEPLAETKNAFVDDYLIKFVSPEVPGARALFLMDNVKEASETLQDTANSICYRFYPKCEVI